jgi:prepilin-type N-terminal cleavage/methylation domain-containing protein/prepilin-type processing-associated H-X9-DG protein
MQHHKRGFTLIELLVVIAIIAILAAILFPVFAQAKAAAKTTATLSNSKQLMTSALIYSNDYDDMTVYLDGNGDPQEGQPGHRLYAVQRLHPYTKNNDIFYDTTVTSGDLPHSMQGAPDDPQDWGDWVLYHNISFNAWGLFGYLDPSSGVYQVSRSLSSQEAISQRAATITSVYPGYDAYGWYSLLNYYAMQPNYADPLDFWRNEIYGASKRHRQGVVVSYADGHAGRVPIKKICMSEGQNNWNAFYAKEPVRTFWGYWYSATE